MSERVSFNDALVFPEDTEDSKHIEHVVTIEQESYTQKVGSALLAPVRMAAHASDIFESTINNLRAR